MVKVGYSVALRKNPLKPDEAPKAYAAPDFVNAPPKLKLVF